MDSNNPVAVNLLSRLSRRNKQLQQLKTLKDDQLQETALLREYNSYILKFIDSNKLDNKFLNIPARDNNQIKNIFSTLKQYQDNLNFYKKFNIENYKKFLLLSKRLEEQEVLNLTNSSIKNIKYNLEYFIDSSFYDLNQTRLSLTDFMFYIKNDLRQQFENQASLFSILVKILFNPSSLWSLKGLALIKNRHEHKKKLFEELKKLNSMCLSALNLNTANFIIRNQTIDVNHSLSLREQNSIKDFLMDKLVQEQMVKDLVLSNQEIKKITISWLEVFTHINKNTPIPLSNSKLKFQPSHNSDNDNFCVKGDHEQRLIKFLHICQAIYKSEVAKHSFGLRSSIIDGIVKYGSSRKLMRRVTRLEKIQPYIDAIESIKNELELFFPYINKHKVEVKEDYMLLDLIDSLVSCTQNNEAKLSTSDIGYQLLDILKHLNYQLRHYQSLSYNFVDNNKNSSNLKLDCIK